MASIDLTGVNLYYPNGHRALRDVTLNASDRELLVIVGPSGCGKSTLLRVISGLEAPASGTVAFDGRDMSVVPPQQRDVAMVFQSYALYPHMTVRQNIGFGLRMRGATPTAIRAAVDSTAAMLGIADVLDRRPAELSGGQRQRVALGRALARRAAVFLLDEPLSNLDPQLRATTRTEVKALHRHLGATMVYVTHDQEEAMMLGTRIAVMRDGAVEQVGAPLDLYEQPRNRFIAQFVGSPMINLCGGRHEAREAGGVVTWAGRDLPWAGRTPFATGRPVDVGIRPQDAVLTGSSDTTADLVGMVTVVEPLGPTALVHLRLEDGATFRVLTPSGATLQEDQRVGVRLRRERVLVFDRTTGERLSADR